MFRTLAIVLFLSTLFAASIPSYCSAQYDGPGYYYQQSCSASRLL